MEDIMKCANWYNVNNQSFYDKIWKIRGCGNGARGSVALTNDNKIIFVRDTRAFL